MRVYAMLWALVLATTCFVAALPANGGGTGGSAGPRKPGYVRMPVSRHKFNGTGKWQGGWHWSPPPGVMGFPPPPQWTHTSTPVHSTSQTKPTSKTTSGSASVANPPSSVPTHSRSLIPTTRSVEPRQSESTRRWGWSSLAQLGGVAYIIQIEIGTPPQQIKVFIDTGSYELWVNPKCSTSASESICESQGVYYPSKSNSSSYVGGNFDITYGTGDVTGSYWADVLNIAMCEIPQVQFAVATDSNYTFSGILGLGYAYPYSISYPSVLTLMVSKQLIAAPIFSLGLGGDQDGFSEIIFGGVNRWKFSGPLAAIPIWPPISQQNPKWIQYWVNLTSVGLTAPNQPSVVYTPPQGFTMPMLIDTGSTLSYIREDLVAQIGQQFEATIDNAGNYIVDCSYRDQQGTVDFGFVNGGMVINVAYKDFIYQQYPGHCMLGVQPADVGSTNYVLGDTFIRGAYLVFDQQSDTVWMNQYYNCGDGVVTVGLVKGDAKNIVGAC